ncbi:glycoside hydrolase family 3 [Ilyomonas limi]|uniref:beta-N-acetylhexosaminidase n=1 Tax=Ilyomonas limi TaxID=2575867 RepID=A0A4U3L473_9BACT|nr:glycoside hydrolase family 3 N-terminal domain-containing protein [Ilyomonas limi]TKK69770.1 glycoside hydrolase family 3 [Ilyomonas limi]
MRYIKSLIIFLFSAGTIVSAQAQHFYKQTPAATHWVDSVYKSLSKAEKIAQLMVVRLSAKTPDGVVFYDDKVADDIRKYNIGSICLFQGSPVQQANFINQFQEMAKTPILFCIDGETGVGMRYDSVAKFPDQLTIGATNDKTLVYAIGKAVGKQCKRAGIQVDYAPVVDINNNPNNPVINFRSFGEDKYKVAKYGVQIMQGMQSEGVMACAKHFPGHGDVAVDSHLDLPVINKSIAQLDSLELYPFKAVFNAGIGSVMIAHLSIPAIDSTAHLPTSLSPNNVNGLLHKQLNFHGISFTDALEMQGVAKYFPQGAAAVQSLKAGNDMLCLPGNVDTCINAIEAALDNNELDWGNIEASVKKVLLAKYNVGLHAVQPVNTYNLTNDLNADVASIRKKVAINAATLLRLNNSTLLPLAANKKVAYVGIGINTANSFTSAIKDKYKADTYFFSYKDNDEKATSILNALGNNYDAVIIGLHQLGKYPGNNFGLSASAVDLMNKIQQNNNTITFVFGNPYAVKNMCNAPNLVVCYEDDAIFQRAAFDVLDGSNKPQGTLPVTVGDVFKYGSGIVK